MSAFIVSFNTIRDCVSLLRNPHDSRSACNALGRRLLEMNNAAVYRSYMHRDDAGEMLLSADEIECFEHDDSTYQYSSHRANRLQIYKSVQCFLYQCNEGDIPDKWEDWKRLDKLHTTLAVFLLGETPEYNAAKWCRE